MEFLKNKTIVIYWPSGYNENSGGVTVLHYLGKLLKDRNINVKMFSNAGPNEIFSDFTNVVDSENTITIYPEIIAGNPLQTKYVIRWILAEVGVNTNKNIPNTWNKNDLVYYFLTEKKMSDSPEKLYSSYNFLTTIYLKQNKFINYKRERKGYCHIFKKSHIHKNGIQIMHPSSSVEFHGFPTYTELVDFFNNFEYFVCYDPMSFLIFLAGLCGCIPILHKKDNISKEVYFKGGSDSNTCFYEYYLDNPYVNYPGIAYGIEDVEYARSTLHLLPELLNKQIEYINNKNIDRFINDLNNFENLKNTVANNY